METVDLERLKSYDLSIYRFFSRQIKLLICVNLVVEPGVDLDEDYRIFVRDAMV